MVDGLTRDTKMSRVGCNGGSEALTVGWEKNGIAGGELVHLLEIFGVVSEF